MAINPRTLRLQQQLREQLDRILDAQTRDLVAAWADAWDEVVPDLNAALVELLVAGERLPISKLMRSRRLMQALAVIRDELERLADSSGVRILGDLQTLIDTAGGAQASIIDSQLPPNSNLVALDEWSRLDERQLRAIVERSTQQITALTKPLAPETYGIVRRELIRGVAAGSSPRETAARMVQRAENRFNFGLSRALVIARTETLDASREAARQGRMQHADTLKGWRWMAQLDARTCPSCWAMAGSVHPIEEFGPDDHQQGRCTALPVTKSWADLGLDIEEPPDLVPDAETAFGALSADEQRAILGPARYEAWTRGDFPMSAWSQRRTNDGWRTSRVAAPAPKPAAAAQSGGRRSRSAA